MRYGLIELVLVFGLVLVLAVYELLSVRRSLNAVDAARDGSMAMDQAQSADPP